MLGVSKLIPILLLVGFTGIAFPMLVFVDVAAGGVGHGTTLFYDGLLSPFSLVRLSFAHDYRVYIALAFVFWISVAVLLALRRYPSCRYTLMALLAIHYAGVFIRCSQEDWSYGLPRVWRALPGMMLLFLFGYLGCQFAIWYFTLRRREAHT